LEYHFPNGNASSAILTFESTPSIELRASGEKTNPFEPSKNEEEAGTRKVKSKGRATPQNTWFGYARVTRPTSDGAEMSAPGFLTTHPQSYLGQGKFISPLGSTV
jgi:hypothetical protein